MTVFIAQTQVWFIYKSFVKCKFIMYVVTVITFKPSRTKSISVTSSFLLIFLFKLLTFWLLLQHPYSVLFRLLKWQLNGMACRITLKMTTAATVQTPEMLTSVIRPVNLEANITEGKEFIFFSWPCFDIVSVAFHQTVHVVLYCNALWVDLSVIIGAGA